MVNHIFTLQKNGYEPFFDFVKAYAIICVLIGHTIPNISHFGYFFWAGMQVPLFLLVQSFHALKKEKSSLNFKKIAVRVLIPFLFMMGMYLVYCALKGTLNRELLLKGLMDGGYGPGCYFPWIFIQMAVILYFARPLLDKGDMSVQCLVAILICESFEILSSYLGMSDKVYRLLAIRYLFLVFLAWAWVKNGIVVNVWTICLSLLSCAAIAYFVYFSESDEPFFFNTSWSCHRWPCYFYLSSLFCAFLYMIYRKVSHYTVICNIVSFLAKSSYEIFLIQMVFIVILKSATY